LPLAFSCHWLSAATIAARVTMAMAAAPVAGVARSHLQPHCVDMHADSLAVGLQRVDVNFCCGKLGAKASKDFLGTSGALTVSISLLEEEPSLVYEWAVLVREKPVLVACAKAIAPAIEISSAHISTDEGERCQAELTLTSRPRFECGMSSWNLEGEFRKPPRWSDANDTGNAALPPLLHRELMRETKHKLVLMYSMDTVREEFERLGIALRQEALPTPLRRHRSKKPVDPNVCADDSPQTPARRKRCLEELLEEKTPQPAPVASSTPLLRVHEASKQLFNEASKEIGSDGLQCDWCGLTPSEGEEQLRVCKRCLYSVCQECNTHPTHGSCYCSDSNFGEPYTRGAARKRCSLPPR